jgi:serine/threonine-protein kinase
VSFGPTSFPAGSLPVPATIPDEQPRVARAQTMARAGTLMNQFGRGQIGSAATLPPTPSPSPISDVRTSQPSVPDQEQAKRRSFVSGPAIDLRASYASASGLSQQSLLGAEVLPKFCPECLVRYPAEFRVCPKDASELLDAEPDDADEFVGRTLADTYAILRPVGEGGMGRVYEARHTRIGKRFALKLLHPEYARQPEVLSRFQREAEAAASIDSPNVGDVYDIGKTADGRPLIVAEFLEGRELAEFLNERGKLEVPMAIRIARQICKALAAAHAKGIVHRDMKPENVFLTGDLASPIVKVIDFGISKVHEAGGQSLTKTGMIMGTPSYMAPEQARGERVDHRADIYAVGAILYQSVTGKRPFDRGDPTATITAVLLEEPERPCDLNPSLPSSLEIIIQRAMAKSASDRYSSMDALEADLAAFSGPGKSSIAPPPALAIANAQARASGSDAAGLSRPTITLMGGLAAFFVLGAIVSVSAAVIRLSRGGGVTANVTGSEASLLILFLTLAMATPIGFAIHYVRKNVWKNSAKTLELAQSMRRLVVSCFVTYGVASLSVRVLEAVLLRRAAGVAWPVWDLVLVALGAAGAAAAYAVFKGDGSSRR